MKPWEIVVTLLGALELAWFVWLKLRERGEKVERRVQVELMKTRLANPSTSSEEPIRIEDWNWQSASYDENYMLGQALAQGAARLTWKTRTNERRYVGSLPGQTSPPRNAKYLFFLFMPPKDCDALVGDLEERFRLILKEFGPAKANFWYWTMALRSVGPTAWAWLKKVAVKPVLGIVGWLVAKGVLHPEALLAVVVEWWKRMRG